MCVGCPIKSGNSCKPTKKELDEHFEELEREAEPIATRYVREVTGESTLRDGEDNMLYLPPFMTMRRCYGKFCLDKRGMRVITTNNGNTSSVPATPDGETKRVPSWSGYCTYWKDNYRNLRIRKPTEDICNYCYKIYNFHKFRSTKKESSVAEEGKEPENLEGLFEERVHQFEEWPDRDTMGILDLPPHVFTTSKKPVSPPFLELIVSKYEIMISL